MRKVILLLVCLSLTGNLFPSPAVSKDGSKMALLDSVKLYDTLSFLNIVRNNELSLKYARKELIYAKRSNDPFSISKAYMSLGAAFSKGLKDSSLTYYNLASQIIFKNNLNSLKPELLYHLSMLSLDASDRKNAILLLDSCIQLSKKLSNYRILSDAYNLYGLIQLELNASSVAKIAFTKALEIGRQHALSVQTGNAIGNLALFETNIDKSIALRLEAVHYLEKEPGAEEPAALALINIGNVQKNPDSAIIYYNRALMLSGRTNLPLVEIAAYNNMADKYLQKNNIIEARNCLDLKALPLAKKMNSLDWMSTLYETYADIEVKSKNYAEAFRYERLSMDTKEKFISTNAEDQMRLLTSLLDLKNKELTIKEDATEIRISNSQNKVLKLELGGAALLILSILVILLWFRQRSKTKLKQEQIASARSLIEYDEAEKGRLGSELHDNIGYLVRIIDRNIQAINFPDPTIQESIRSQLGDMGETIRRLSHRMNPLKKEETPFKDLFADIVNDMRNLAGVNVKYFAPDKLPELSKEITLHLCRITQELLTNASKYAKESSVLIRVGITSNHILLLYSDDGPGFDQNSDQVNGIGLRSIKARVNILNGESILTTEPGSGTNWEITIPLK